MPKEGFAALVGYAIGTAQILALDWCRARWTHARQLRLVRADLRRVAEFQAKFNLRTDHPPESDELPRPASLSPNFLSTVGATDFWITDEHRDDNSQEALLGVADGFVALSDIHARAMKELDIARSSTDAAERRKHFERLVAYGAEYDREVDYIQYLVKDSLRDVERRIKVVRWWRQVPRLLRPMPKGSNPPPLKRGDPRLHGGHADSEVRDA